MYICFFVPGSTINAAVGLGSLKEQKEHFQRVIVTHKPKSFTDAVKERLQHGTSHEIDAKATLLGKIMPIYCPGKVFKDVGSYILLHNEKTFCIASPDGEAWEQNSLSMTFELKCPFPKKFTPTVFYEVPKYYIPQILSQMNMAPDGAVEEAIFLSWSFESSTAFFIQNDPALWAQITEELVIVYGKDHPIIPKKKSDSSIALKNEIERFLKQNVHFLGEFRSTKAIECVHYFDSQHAKNVDNVYRKHVPTSVTSDDDAPSILDIEQALHNAETAINDAFVLTRQRATDVIVFMLSDLDRVKSINEAPLAIPVFYGLAGSSISSDIIRNLTNFIRKFLKDKGIHVLTQGFDGQMCPLAVCDNEGYGLSLLKEQKDFFRQISRLSKQQIASTIESIVFEEKRECTAQLPSGTFDIFPDIDAIEDAIKLDIKLLNHMLVRAVHASLELVKPYKPEIDQENWAAESLDALRQCIHVDVRGRGHLISNHQPSEVNHVQCNETGHNIFAGFEGDINDQVLMSFLEEIETEEIVCNPRIKDVSESNVDGLGDVLSQMEQDRPPVEETHDEMNYNSPTKCMQDDTKGYLQVILTSLQTASQKLHDKWRHTTIDELDHKLGNANIIKNSMTLEDLRTIVKALKSEPILTGCDLKLLHYKADYVNLLSQLFGDKSTIESKSPQSQTKKQLKHILESRLKKHALNVVLCTLLWPRKISDWYKKGFFPNKTEILGTDQTVTWLTQPERDQDGQPVFTLLDFHHLLTNTRCHIGRSGYPSAGIRRDAWVKVAEEERTNHTGLNLAFVEDGIDPQSNSVAQLFFSQKVEKVMRENGDMAEAEFAANMRDWYSALDQRGLPSAQRASQLLKFRDWLMKRLLPKLIRFPPVANSVCDIPLGNFHGLLISIERYLQIFPFVHGGTFNPRALGSQINETFFSSFRDLDPRSEGVLKPKDLPKAMSISCQLLEARLDPERYELWFPACW